jgi:hypothetical protein
VDFGFLHQPELPDAEPAGRRRLLVVDYAVEPVIPVPGRRREYRGRLRTTDHADGQLGIVTASKSKITGSEPLIGDLLS